MSLFDHGCEIEGTQETGGNFTLAKISWKGTLSSIILLQHVVPLLFNRRVNNHPFYATVEVLLNNKNLNGVSYVVRAVML
jgi:hypothetical protein